MDLCPHRSGSRLGREGKSDALRIHGRLYMLTSPVFDRLPLDAVQLTIAELSPKVQELQANGSRASSTAAILDLLRSANLSHVLPPPGPLAPRKFHVSALSRLHEYYPHTIILQWSDASLVWLNSLLWGEIYVRGTTPLGIWNGTNVRLFGVKHTPQPRRVTDTVQTVMGGFWGGAGAGGAANSQAGTATPPAPVGS
jgi:hypothetical protein